MNIWDMLYASWDTAKTAQSGINRIARKLAIPTIGMALIVIIGDVINTYWIIPKCGDSDESLVFIGMCFCAMIIWWIMWIRHWKRKANNAVMRALLFFVYVFFFVVLLISLLAVCGVMICAT